MTKNELAKLSMLLALAEDAIASGVFADESTIYNTEQAQTIRNEAGEIISRLYNEVKQQEIETILCPRCNGRMLYIEGGKAIRCQSCHYIMVSIG